jgi:hypothetical protein
VPKKKKPWAELDGKRIGFIWFIMERVGKKFDRTIDDGLYAEQEAVGHAGNEHSKSIS